jgi:hypothetical protein
VGMSEGKQTYTAFAGEKLIASGTLETVLRETMRHSSRHDLPPVLIFEDLGGRRVDFDLSGSVEQVLARALPPSHAGPGRPRLGVVSREVSLLPRHWEWLESQRNGASAAIRRLVDEARNRDPGNERARLAMDRAYRFMTAMTGDRKGYEEALRALYAGRRIRFENLIRDWPEDIKAQVMRLAHDAFGGPPSLNDA